MPSTAPLELGALDCCGLLPVPLSALLLVFWDLGMDTCTYWSRKLKLIRDNFFAAIFWDMDIWWQHWSHRNCWDVGQGCEPVNLFNRPQSIQLCIGLIRSKTYSNLSMGQRQTGILIEFCKAAGLEFTTMVESNMNQIEPSYWSNSLRISYTLRVLHVLLWQPWLVLQSPPHQCHLTPPGHHQVVGSSVYSLFAVLVSLVERSHLRHLLHCLGLLCLSKSKVQG